ncbi:ABC transporter permease [Caldanaerobius polysaccharolyticus]|uniref:ABC transporter permease n=1 Tax=Caldanaerobius polysaccharolyticus TaxID=44256 RepID=UPI00047D4267|nr:ABC transporter permease [Caldanaerobius polysaccharolyticus]
MQSKSNISNNTFSGFKKIEWRKYIVYIAFVAVFVFFAITLHSEGFTTLTNLLNITRQTAMISIMAVAMTFVIAAGQIDLSVGSITALTSLVTALILAHNGSIFLAVLGGFLIGAAIGAINGLLITKTGIPAFLATLGTMGIARGLAMWITNTAPVPILNETYNFLFGTGDIGGFPVLFIWTIIVLIIGHFVLNHTPYGKQTLATGGNEIAAKYTGINTQKIKFIVMTVSGIAASFAGMLYAGRMQAGRYSFGDGDELSVIAAVILGGTSMAGGTGSIIGSVIGSLLMGMINNGLIIAGLDVSQQMVVRGIIIILAVALGNKYQNKD